MKILALPLLALWCIISAPLRADPPAAAPAIPAALEVPAGQMPVFTVAARGFQIYECRAVPGDPQGFEWVLKAPEADLLDSQGKKVGRHYAGPSWELNDGSKVVGHVKAKADAPDGKGAPWLLLEAVSNSGEGVLSRVQTIQRIYTVGGKPPTSPASAAMAGQEKRVDYTATYLFYTSKL